MANNQLLGRNYQQEMVPISRNIYCLKSEYRKLKYKAKNARQAACRLLLGVFTYETFRDNSLITLNEDAVQAIIRHAKRLEEENGWKQVTIGDIRHAMSMKINQLKISIKKEDIISAGVFLQCFSSKLQH